MLEKLPILVCRRGVCRVPQISIRALLAAIHPAQDASGHTCALEAKHTDGVSVIDHRRRWGVEGVFTRHCAQQPSLGAPDQPGVSVTKGSCKQGFSASCRTCSPQQVGTLTPFGSACAITAPIESWSNDQKAWTKCFLYLNMSFVVERGESSHCPRYFAESWCRNSDLYPHV